MKTLITERPIRYIIRYIDWGGCVFIAFKGNQLGIVVRVKDSPFKTGLTTYVDDFGLTKSSWITIRSVDLTAEISEISEKEALDVTSPSVMKTIKEWNYS